MSGAGERWVRFLRQYGPTANNENMFDEHIRRLAGRSDIRPLMFRHPLEQAVLGAFVGEAASSGVVVLTGTPGDGKSHLAAKIWEALRGDPGAWRSNEIYFTHSLQGHDGMPVRLHVIRDLTALPDEDAQGRYASKSELLTEVSARIFDPGGRDRFLVAANDGQLMEVWRRVDTPEARRAHKLLEARLMGDPDPEPGASLQFFNLSQVPSAQVLDLALNALLEHEGWLACYADADPDGFFGPNCPIRINYERLRAPEMQDRLRLLFRLCDYNDLHTPIRRVLLLLANAILGHPKARDRLLQPADVRERIAKADTHLASLYGNLFGANLSSIKQESLEIISYLRRFGIGHETTNRIDNILIFGAEDPHLRPYHAALLANDPIYGETPRYKAAQRAYLEQPDATAEDRDSFVEMLVEQRRALFFKIPESMADELQLWSLTVFAGAGDYLRDIAEPIAASLPVSRKVVAALVNGLNRVFTGMLVSYDRELLLAVSLSYSSARVSPLLEDRIAVQSRGRSERVDIGPSPRGFPTLNVVLPNGRCCSLRLNLTRYEFLMRVSEGALPGNFSRECYEDILAFKSALLAAGSAHADEGGSEELGFRLLSLDASGAPIEKLVEIARA